jgi:hypothetical protein
VSLVLRQAEGEITHNRAVRFCDVCQRHSGGPCTKLHWQQFHVALLLCAPAIKETEPRSAATSCQGACVSHTIRVVAVAAALHCHYSEQVYASHGSVCVQLCATVYGNAICCVCCND